MLGSRNKEGLTDSQVDYCLRTWQFLCGEHPRRIDVTEAHRHGSQTRFIERTMTVILGADAYPGIGATANSRLSVLACLAHELAHLERFEMDFDRPFDPPDNFVDEAETSLHASFVSVLTVKEREDLIEDARDRLIDWLAAAGGKIHDPS